MSFRTRITLVAAAAVAVAVALASAGAYVAVRNVLRGEVDDALKARAHDIQVPRGFPTPDFRVLERPFLGGAPGYIQLVGAERRGRPTRRGVDPAPEQRRAVRSRQGTGSRSSRTPPFPGRTCGS